MDRTTIYSGNLAILLAIIFFLGLSADAFGGSATFVMKRLFRNLGIILITITLLCSISLFSLVVGDVITWRRYTSSKLLDRLAYLLLLLQILLLIVFTIYFTFSLMELM